MAETRRDFLGKACIVSGCAGCAFALKPVLAYLLPPESSLEEQTFTCPLDEIPDGGSRTVQIEGLVVLVIRKGETVKAFNAKCTDLGCVVGWSSERNQIVCPCHDGIFDAEGKVVSGPPPTDLPAVPAEVKDGQVILRVRI